MKPANLVAACLLLSTLPAPEAFTIDRCRPVQSGRRLQHRRLAIVVAASVGGEAEKDAVTKEMEQLKSANYGEESRQYRRTVYTSPNDWVTHRSTTRIFSNLGSMFTSGIVRSLQEEVGAVAAVAVAVVLWVRTLSLSLHPPPPLYLHSPTTPHIPPPSLQNGLARGELEAAGVALPLPLLTLPPLPFTLSSPALGLLLVFRTNASYGRWLEARKAWDVTTSSCRSIIRQLVAWQPLDEVPSQSTVERVEDAAALASAFARASQLTQQRSVSDPAGSAGRGLELGEGGSRQGGEEAFDEAFAEALLASTVLPLKYDDAQLIAAASHRPMAALSRLSVAVSRASADLEDGQKKVGQ